MIQRPPFPPLWNPGAWTFILSQRSFHPLWTKMENHMIRWIEEILHRLIGGLSHYWLVVWTPLKNISQLGWLFPIYGKIKNVPNHQPAIIYRLSTSFNHPTFWWCSISQPSTNRCHDMSWMSVKKSATTQSDDMIFLWKTWESDPIPPIFDIPIPGSHCGSIPCPMGFLGRAFSPARLMSSLNRPGNGKPPTSHGHGGFRRNMRFAQFMEGFQWIIPRKNGFGDTDMDLESSPPGRRQQKTK